MGRLETPLDLARRRAGMSLSCLRHHGHLILALPLAKPELLAVAEDSLAASLALRLRRQRELEQIEEEIRAGRRTAAGLPLLPSRFPT